MLVKCHSRFQWQLVLPHPSSLQRHHSIHRLILLHLLPQLRELKEVHVLNVEVDVGIMPMRQVPTLDLWNTLRDVNLSLFVKVDKGVGVAETAEVGTVSA